MTRSALFFAALIAIGALFLLASFDFGTLPMPTAQWARCS